MDDDGNAGEPVNVARDTLVEFMCKSGGREKNEKYQVLGIFCKYYNKWFVSLQEIIGWGENNPEEKLKKTHEFRKLAKIRCVCFIILPVKKLDNI